MGREGRIENLVGGKKNGREEPQKKKKDDQVNAIKQRDRKAMIEELTSDKPTRQKKKKELSSFRISVV